MFGNGNGSEVRSILRLLVSAYVAYLGVQVIRGVLGGDASMPPVLGFVIGAVFIAAAAAFALYTLFGAMKKDGGNTDPGQDFAEEADSEK